MSAQRAEEAKEKLAEAVANYTNVLLEATEPQNIHRTLTDVLEVNEIMVLKAHTGGNQSKSADLMGINRATLREKLKRHGML